MTPDIPAVLAAHRDEPHLRVWDALGARPVPAGDQVGEARYPTTSSTGWVAFQVVTRGTPLRWLAVTALLDSSYRLVDLLPSALATTAPAWSPDGSRLARVVTDHAGGTALELVDATSGRAQIVREALGITAVAWPAADRLIMAERACLVAVDLRTGNAAMQRRWPEAERFLRSGTDDYYPTIAHVTVAGERVLIGVRWHQAGKPAAAAAYSWVGERPSRLAALDGCRHPVITADRRMLASAEDLLVTLGPAGERQSLRRLPSLHEATPLPRL